MFQKIFSLKSFLKILWIIICLLWNCGAGEQNHDNQADRIINSEIKPVLYMGSRLLYLVEVAENVKYNLEVEFTSIEPELTFNFLMNNMDFTFGSVQVSPIGLSEGSTLMSHFEDGNTNLPNDCTALILSEKNYSDIILDRKTTLSINKKPQEEFFLQENDYLKFELDSITYSALCFHLATKNNSHQIWVMKNNRLPILIKLISETEPKLTLLEWKTPSRI